MDELLVGGSPRLDIADPTGIEQRNTSMPKRVQVLEGEPRATVAVRIDCREAGRACALTHRHHRHGGSLQVGEQARLVHHIAHQQDCLAVADFEHLRQRFHFLGAAARVAKHQVVATPPCLERDHLQHRRKEGVGDVTHDQAEQGGSCAA